MTTVPTILTVDDDADSRAAIVRVLAGAGCKTAQTGSAEKAVDVISRHDVDILISNLRLPGMDGIELLKAAKKIAPSIEVILIAAYGSAGMAVEALRQGAYDFITRPVRKPYLLRAVERAAEKQRLARENLALRSQVRGRCAPVIHNGSGMSAVMRMVTQVGPSSAAVLITGECGTGKDVIAETIHAASPRRDRPLVKVSCGALPETLLESELFGCEEGAFTGAVTCKEGRLDLARGGTLFLDEIGEIPPVVQVKLLRVLQDGRFERLGSSRTIDADVRIIAATNKDLAGEVAERRFREDLFFRISVVSIHLPPLRERRSDIPLLAMHFLKLYADKNRKKIDGFSDAAMQALVAYDWSGNVRELENAVEGAVVFTNTRLVPLSVFPQFIPCFTDLQHSLTFKIGTSWHELERQAIEIALVHSRGDKMMAARLLGVSSRSIYRYLYRLG
jgi:two-component system response regulator HydG